MKNAFQERKTKLKTFRNDLVELRYIKEKNPFTAVEIPDDLLYVCHNCKSNILTDEMEDNLFICPNCGYPHALGIKDRLNQIADEYNEYLPNLELKEFDFEGYEEKYKAYQQKTGLKDALGCYFAKIKDVNIALGIMDASFMMASMGSVVGDKLTSFIEEATKRELPLILFCASGGARMQEGIISLMQMVKTSAAIARHKKKNLLYISVFTNPTTGGVSASFASLGDISIAEPNTLIGFAGRRVIENTIKEQLPKEFQTSEFLLDKGFIDMVVERKELKDTLYKILKIHRY